MTGEYEDKSEQPPKTDEAPVVMQAETAERSEGKPERVERQPQYDAFMRIIRR